MDVRDVTELSSDQPQWYTFVPADTLQALDVDATCGLSEAEAQRRLAETGPNSLEESRRTPVWSVLWDQLRETMVVILVAAALISALIDDVKDAVVILAIVLLNVTLGAVQQLRAERAIEALRRLATPTVHVRRDGRTRELSASDLVPGDIVQLEAGKMAPADGRLLEANRLEMQEAALTGESAPVDKMVEALTQEDLALADRRNMAYMGTSVTSGRGLAVVTATGMQTELGHVASLLQRVKRNPTPLQRRLDQLGKWLALIALSVVAVVFLVGVVQGGDIREMFLVAVSLAVASLPEGLPAVVTIALALGAHRMLRRHALIRKLPAVETLGSVTVICSDKTGTLTQNRMTVTTLDVAGDRVDVTELLREGEQEVDARIIRASPEANRDPALRALLASAALCGDARLVAEVPPPTDQTEPATSGEYQVIGDATEGAIVVAATRVGLSKVALDAAFPRVGEAPFDSMRKRMTTVHRFAAERPHAFASVIDAWMCGEAQEEHVGAGRLILCKGAVSAVLEVCTGVYTEAGWAALSAIWRARILRAEADLAGRGMRVLGVAFGARSTAIEQAPPAQIERGLTFAGLVGLIDPARPEAKAAIETCQCAGIRPIMITGDHPLTAAAIGEEMGIAGGRVVTGPELLARPSTSLDEVVETVSVYARVAPDDKLAIVRALQANGEIVAMTGDGVNDAPALKKVDIGVAMGLSGTDVAKDAADIVLLDDNFATIVAAVEEGRVIYDNIRKFVRYLLATNSGELWVMLLYPLVGLPLPLLPLQILWINLVTDGLPALALSAEPAERNTMRRPPRPPNESLFAHGLGWHVVWVGLLISALCLGGGFWLRLHVAATWQTLLFTTLAFTQMAHVLAIRTEHDSVLRSGFWTNRALIAAVGLAVALQLAVVYLPPLEAVFGAQALAPSELALSLGFSAIVFGAVECEKWLWRRAAGRNMDAKHE